MQRRVIFNNRLLPYGLLAPQLCITLIFFFWPAFQAVYQSVFIQDPFGLRTQFVWFENFKVVLSDPYYLGSVRVTFTFAFAVTSIAMSSARGQINIYGAQGFTRPFSSGPMPWLRL